MMARYNKRMQRVTEKVGSRRSATVNAYFQIVILVLKDHTRPSICRCTRRKGQSIFNCQRAGKGHYGSAYLIAR